MSWCCRPAAHPTSKLANRGEGGACFCTCSSQAVLLPLLFHLPLPNTLPLPRLPIQRRFKPLDPMFLPSSGTQQTIRHDADGPEIQARCGWFTGSVKQFRNEEQLVGRSERLVFYRTTSASWLDVRGALTDDPKKAKTLAATPAQTPPYIALIQTGEPLMLQRSLVCRLHPGNGRPYDQLSGYGPHSSGFCLLNQKKLVCHHDS